MPLYEFVCNCGHNQEELMGHKKADKLKIVCEKCGTVMKKKIHSPNFIMKAGKLGNAANGYTNTNIPKVK